MKLFNLLPGLFFIFIGCSSNSSGTVAKTSLQKSSQVSIMTFNVENLFDTRHDKGKSDYTFLPLSQKKGKKHIDSCRRISRKKWRDQCLYWDWSEKVLAHKLKRIAGSIRQVAGGEGPDIIVFQEVENIQILERLRLQELKGLGYKKSILIEGTDIRGIDVAFMSKLETKGPPSLTHVPYKNISSRRKKDTRGILQQTFILPGGELITGFAAHFPAPFHPYPLRIESYKFLNQLKKNLPKNRLTFAAGDFNTPTAENRKHKILDKYVKSEWLVAHEEGCSSCPGTNYYAPKKSWSFLDMILLSKEFANKSKGWQLSKVFLANNYKEQKSSKGRPNSFKVQNNNVYGVSDHWPLVVVLNNH